MQKAFATLDRGSNYPYINAMSGYSHPGWPNVLDNEVWTDKAEDLRKSFGLPEDKTAASHVEPQLLAYLLDRHSLFSMFEDESDCRDFESAKPAYALQPNITVNKPEFCAECFEFFDCFKARFPGSGVVFHFIGDSLAAPLRVRT